MLDISYNHFTNFTSIDLSLINHLRELSLSGNPLSLILFSSLQTFLCGPGRYVDALHVKDTGVTFIEAQIFTCGQESRQSPLRHLDISQNELQLVKSSLQGLISLQQLITDEQVICCIFYNLFPLSKADCDAPEDIVSTCTDLLNSNFLRVCLWILCCMSLLGNGTVLVYRIFFESRKSAIGFHIFVISLGLSDFVMGLYMLIIGSADLHYKGGFLWQRWEWKDAPLCVMAGVLGLVSSEVSAMTICLVMLDRLLAVRFPLHKHLHFSWRSASLLVLVSWTVGSVLAAVPLLSVHHHWRFYTQNGICLPLPVSWRDFDGQRYAFAIFVVVNFVIFLMIMIGQFFIYLAVVSSSSRVSSTATNKDVAIARRLFVVVISDFFCWLPVGVMGLMANAGINIPGEVNVWTAVFILPLNSALNPFLYTFSKYRQKQQELNDKKRYAYFLRKSKAENMKVTT